MTLLSVRHLLRLSENSLNVSSMETDSGMRLLIPSQDSLIVSPAAALKLVYDESQIGKL